MATKQLSGIFKLQLLFSLGLASSDPGLIILGGRNEAGYFNETIVRTDEGWCENVLIPPLPAGGSVLTGALVNGFLLVCGFQGVSTDDCYYLKNGSTEWIPSPLKGTSQIFRSGTYYSAAGIFIAFVDDNDNYEFNMQSNRMEAVNATHMSSWEVFTEAGTFEDNISLMKFTEYKDKLYMTGGRLYGDCGLKCAYKKSISPITLFSIEDGWVQRIHNFTQARDSHSCIPVELESRDGIFCTGGVDYLRYFCPAVCHHNATTLDTTEFFTGLEVTNLAKLNHPRLGHGLVQFQSEIFVIGGLEMDYDENEYFTDSVEVFDGNEWKDAEWRLPQARAGFALIKTNEVETFCEGSKTS